MFLSIFLLKYIQLYDGAGRMNVGKNYGCLDKNGKTQPWLTIYVQSLRRQIFKICYTIACILIIYMLICIIVSTYKLM